MPHFEARQSKPYIDTHGLTLINIIKFSLMAKLVIENLINIQFLKLIAIIKRLSNTERFKEFQMSIKACNILPIIFGNFVILRIKKSGMLMDLTT